MAAGGTPLPPRGPRRGRPSPTRGTRSLVPGPHPARHRGFRGLRVAVELALGTDSELHVSHVLPTSPAKPPFLRLWERGGRAASPDAARVAALALLEDKTGEAEKLGRTVAGSHYREGRADKEVARLAEDLEAGLVVAGFRERGPADSPFSRGLSGAVLRHVRCAVVVVRGSRGC